VGVAWCLCVHVCARATPAANYDDTPLCPSTPQDALPHPGFVAQQRSAWARADDEVDGTRGARGCCATWALSAWLMVRF
jgi:hypothetical protein